MLERGNGTEPVHNRESILSRDIVETILQGARENLATNGSLIATLFLKLDSGERTILPLSMPETPVEKQAYFTQLGFSVRDNGGDINEAILVSESWYIAPVDGKYPDQAPSEHPDRKEAITLAGRDALGLRYVFAIQPFHHDHQNGPVFNELELYDFDGNLDHKSYSTGLLDYLFKPVDLNLH